MQTPAQYFARIVLLILFVTSGLSLSLSLLGQRELAWPICGGGVLLVLVVLGVGSAMVGRARRQ